jgi:DHA2 family multidrug resistance protein
MKNPVKILCLSLSFLILFNFSVTNMASLYILGSLGGSTDTASYSVAFFGLGNALTIPLGNYLKGSIKQSMMICLCLFAFFSFLAGFAPTYPFFIVIRFLQGCASGPLIIMAVALMTPLASKEERMRFMRSLTIVIISASVFGSCWGAIFAYEWTWRWIFHIDIFFMLALALIISKFIKETKDPLIPKIDYPGYIAYLLFLGGMGTFIIVGQELDWLRSSFLCALLILSLMAGIFFTLWSQSVANPIISFNLLRQRGFFFGLIQTAVFFSAYFGILLLLSLWLNIYVHYTMIWLSIMLALMITCTITMMIIMNRFTFHLKLEMLMGAILLLALSCFLTTFFNSEVDFKRIAISRVIGGVGLALFLPPLLHFLLGFSKDHEGLEAITLFQVTRALFSSLGAAIYTTMWQRRYVFFYERLGGQLTIFSQNTKDFFLKLKPFQFSKKIEIAQMQEGLDRQAKALALDDCFYFMGFTLLFLFIALVIYISFKKLYVSSISK